MTIAPPLLVIGAGGLLGSHVVRSIPSAMGPPVPIPWESDPIGTLEEVARWFGRWLDGNRGRVAWCAGAGVVGTTPEALAAETHSLGCFLEALGTSAARSLDAFFLASSAGGVHAGSRDDPVTERSAVAPISAYGQSKDDQEGLVRTWSEETAVPVVIGRFSNLYGPGQDLTKPQGLISRLVRASVRSEPMLVFVSLDTSRDYLFAPDAARLVGALIDRVASQAGSRDDGVTIKLVASGRAATIGEVIAELHRIRKRRPPIVFGVTAATALQPAALRFRSEVWPDLDRTRRVTLAEGIAAVVRDQLGAVAAGASL